MEKRKTEYWVHIWTFRYMFSSFQHHFGLETSQNRSPKLALAHCGQNRHNKRSSFYLLFRAYPHIQESENEHQWKWRCVEVQITPDLLSTLK